MSPADRRIAEKELELARVQTETTPLQVEAKLTRQTLAVTLASAAVIASYAVAVIATMTSDIDANIQRMADDLNGGRDR